MKGRRLLDHGATKARADYRDHVHQRTTPLYLDLRELIQSGELGALRRQQDLRLALDRPAPGRALERRCGFWMERPLVAPVEQVMHGARLATRSTSPAGPVTRSGSLTSTRSAGRGWKQVATSAIRMNHTLKVLTTEHQRWCQSKRIINVDDRGTTRETRRNGEAIPDLSDRIWIR